MIRARTFTRHDELLGVFEDGKPHTLQDVAVACQMPVMDFAWVLASMARIGRLERLSVPPGGEGAIYRRAA